jgi:hypothetical protein
MEAEPVNPFDGLALSPWDPNEDPTKRRMKAETLAVYRLDTLSVWIDFFLNTGLDEFGDSPRAEQLVRDFPGSDRDQLRNRVRALTGRMRQCADALDRALDLDAAQSN